MDEDLKTKYDLLAKVNEQITVINNLKQFDIGDTFQLQGKVNQLLEYKGYMEKVIHNVINRQRLDSLNSTAKGREGREGRESILIILASNEMNPEFIPQIKELAKYIEHLSKKYTVDVACISSKDDFENYSEYIKFKYTYINTNRQFSKICSFISDTKDALNYDWFLKTRPEIVFADFETIDYEALPNDSISARARVYFGPYRNEYACSVGGKGDYQHIKGCFYRDTLERIVLDDIVYVFHRNVIDRGGFAKLNSDGAKEDEYFHSFTWSSRNIKLNVIGINVTLHRVGTVMYSGGVL